MKINCLSCGHTLELDEAYSDYEGGVKCYTCNTLLEIKLEEGQIKFVKFFERTGAERPDAAATAERLIHR